MTADGLFVYRRRGRNLLFHVTGGFRRGFVNGARLRLTGPVKPAPLWLIDRAETAETRYEPKTHCPHRHT
jgi:hypothetical protein